MKGQNIDITGKGFELGPVSQGAMRLDAKELAKHRVQLNARHFDNALIQNGFHMARQLEHVYSEVLREEFPPQSSMEAFPVDTSVPAGARTHTVRRLSQQGEAKVYRGNSADVPRAACALTTSPITRLTPRASWSARSGSRSHTTA